MIHLCCNSNACFISLHVETSLCKWYGWPWILSRLSSSFQRVVIHGSSREINKDAVSKMFLLYRGFVRCHCEMFLSRSRAFRNENERQSVLHEARLWLRRGWKFWVNKYRAFVMLYKFLSPLVGVYWSLRYIRCNSRI